MVGSGAASLPCAAGSRVEAAGRPGRVRGLGSGAPGRPHGVRDPGLLPSPASFGAAAWPRVVGVQRSGQAASGLCSRGPGQLCVRVGSPLASHDGGPGSGSRLPLPCHLAPAPQVRHCGPHMRPTIINKLRTTGLDESPDSNKFWGKKFPKSKNVLFLDQNDFLFQIFSSLILKKG